MRKAEILAGLRLTPQTWARKMNFGMLAYDLAELEEGDSERQDQPVARVGQVQALAPALDQSGKEAIEDRVVAGDELGRGAGAGEARGRSAQEDGHRIEQDVHKSSSADEKAAHAPSTPTAPRRLRARRETSAQRRRTGVSARIQPQDQHGRGQPLQDPGQRLALLGGNMRDRDAQEDGEEKKGKDFARARRFEEVARDQRRDPGAEGTIAGARQIARRLGPTCSLVRDRDVAGPTEQSLTITGATVSDEKRRAGEHRREEEDGAARQEPDDPSAARADDRSRV